MSGALRPALVGLAVAAAGCFSDPLAETSRGDAGSEGSPSTSGAPTSTSTGGPTTTSTSTGDASTSTTGVEPTTTSTDSTTGTTTTSGSTTATTGPPLETVVVHPELAACAFLASNGAPYGGPLECTNAATTTNATQVTGVLTIDATTNYSLNREARIFLRFEIPAEVDPEAATVTLTIHVADNPSAGGPAGELHLAEAFSNQSLTTAAPGLLDLLAVNIELLAPDGAGTWLVPSDAVKPGEPLYLGLRAISDDGVLYRGSPADVSLAPSLTIEHP